jgi:hypothetical protein
MKKTLAVLLLIASPLAAEPAIQFNADGVQVGGFGSGTIAWLGMVREPVDHHMRVRIERGMKNILGLGTALIPEANVEVSRSIWAVVSVAGTALHAAAPDYSYSAQPIVINAVPGETTFAVESPLIELMYVRPGVGIWSFGCGDGADLDADLELNGTIVVSLSSLQNMGRPAPLPETVQESDLIVAIDPYGIRLTQMAVAE